MPLSRRWLLFLSLVVVLPIGIFEARAMEFDLQILLNPCNGYGAGSGTITVLQGGGCSTSVSPSEAIPGLLMTALIPGGVLVGLALGVLGTLRGRSTLLAASFVILSLESAPLLWDGFFVVFALVPAVFFLLEARTKFLFR